MWYNQLIYEQGGEEEMKKLIIVLMVVLGSISYSWKYDGNFNYYKNVKNNYIINFSEDKSTILGIEYLKKYDVELFKLMLEKKVTDDFIVMFYFDDVLFNDAYSFNSEKGFIKFKPTEEFISNFKKHKTLVVALSSDSYSTVQKFSLMGFTKEYNKLK